MMKPLNEETDYFFRMLLIGDNINTFGVIFASTKIALFSFLLSAE